MEYSPNLHPHPHAGYAVAEVVVGGDKGKGYGEVCGEESIMSLPPVLEKKYIDRFDELIRAGETIEKNMKTISGRRFGSFVQPERVRQEPDKHVVDWSDFIQWRTNCLSLLSQIIPVGHAHKKSSDDFGRLTNKLDHLQWGISTLKALKEDFEKGLLGDLLVQVEAEISGDYMGQAEQLLEEGQSGKFDHVPAAVLSGAVLEKALKTLCNLQQPAIPVLKSNGEPKTMNPLIDDLKKAGLFNEAKAKQLRAWADIRNHAAHGDFDQFNRKDVEQMINGVNNFLVDYLK